MALATLAVRSIELTFLYTIRLHTLLIRHHSRAMVCLSHSCCNDFILSAHRRRYSCEYHLASSRIFRRSDSQADLSIVCASA